MNTTPDRNEWADLARRCRRASADLDHARRRLTGDDVPDRVTDAATIAADAARTLAATARRLAVLAERRERHHEGAAL